MLSTGCFDIGSQTFASYLTEASIDDRTERLPRQGEEANSGMTWTWIVSAKVRRETAAGEQRKKKYAEEDGKDYGASEAMTERPVIAVAALIFRIVRIYNGLYWREN